MMTLGLTSEAPNHCLTKEVVQSWVNAIIANVEDMGKGLAFCLGYVATVKKGYTAKLQFHQ